MGSNCESLVCLNLFCIVVSANVFAMNGRKKLYSVNNVPGKCINAKIIIVS